MGILDDAIKEHLDLKRQHGADDSEVQKLEDEAFGPPARPGEPDFPDTGEEQATGEANGAPEAPTAEPEAGSEDATTLLEPEPVPVPEPPSEEQPAEVELPSEALPSEPEPEESPPSDTGAFYDQASEREPGIEELDLDLEDEGDAAPPEEHPVTGLETVEHPMEELLADDAEDAEPPPPEAPPEQPPEGGETEEADVLEETPEFLRDQPEDDELWFEQGEPKDFDF